MSMQGGIHWEMISFMGEGERMERRGRKHSDRREIEYVYSKGEGQG